MLEQLHVTRRGAALALAGVLLAAIDVAASTGHRLVEGFLLVAAATSLAWLDTAPLVTALVVAAAVPTLSAAGVPPNAPFTVLIVVALASYFLGTRARRRTSVMGVAALAAGATVSVALDGRSLASNVPFALLLIAAPYGMGVAMRVRHDYAEAMRERADLLAARADETAAAAVAAERTRIARELHDLVAHSLTVVGLQAGGVRRLLLPEQRRERDALALVEQTTRQAQEEMRHLLSLLRTDEATTDLTPEPGLARLPALIDETRVAGMHVQLDATGPLETLPRGVDLAAYRIVQEALTNARKHGTATAVIVRLAATTTTLQVEVVDNGTAVTAASQPGYGLIGMRERAALYGGDLDARPAHGGGWRVASTLTFRPTA